MKNRESSFHNFGVSCFAQMLLFVWQLSSGAPGEEVDSPTSHPVLPWFILPIGSRSRRDVKTDFIESQDHSSGS